MQLSVKKKISYSKNNFILIYNFSSNTKNFQTIITENDVRSINSLLQATFRKRKITVEGEESIPIFKRIGKEYLSVCPYFRPCPHYRPKNKDPNEKLTLMVLKKKSPGNFSFKCLHCICTKSPNPKSLIRLEKKMNTLFRIYHLPKLK